jgi:hypothetical protein
MAITNRLCAAGVLLLALVPSAVSAQSGEEQADTAETLIAMRLARQSPAPGYERLPVARSTSFL